MNNLKLMISLFSLIGLFSMSCSSTHAQPTKNVNSNYEIAPDEYEAIADKAIKHIEKFNFSSFYNMLADDVEYYLPDGDQGTRTSFIGKKAVMGFWDSYEEKSGNTKIVGKDFVHVGVIAKKELNYSKLTGVIVLSYFSLEMHFGQEKTNIRMHWAFHFDEDKKIDKIYSYYDRTPIIAAAKRNLLSKENN